MASPRLSLGFLASALLSLAVARSTPPTAAATVSADSNAGFPLFEAERVQLTDKVLKEVRDLDAPSGQAGQYAFDDNKNASSSQQPGSCKPLPGDSSWPSDDVWDFFNGLLGGALVPVTPVSAPCYKDSSYDNYDAKKCAAITKNFTTPELQYVLRSLPLGMIFFIRNFQLTFT